MMCMSELSFSCKSGDALHHHTIIGMGHTSHSTAHDGGLVKQFTSLKADGLTSENAAVTGRG